MTQVYGKRGWVGGNPPTVPFKLNECSPQARGLIGWWPALGSRGGNVWYDLSGRGINLAKASTPADISVDTLDSITVHSMLG
jgi:hypothetical protein